MSTKVSSTQREHRGTHSPVFWVTLVRGFFAILLSLALSFQPERTQSTLLTFMGIFWLMNGIISIRWGYHWLLGLSASWPVLALFSVALQCLAKGLSSPSSP
jgi:uncharacterized membrane protein HdeD (DUF308 family)